MTPAELADLGDGWRTCSGCGTVEDAAGPDQDGEGRSACCTPPEVHGLGLVLAAIADRDPYGAEAALAAAMGQPPHPFTTVDDLAGVAAEAVMIAADRAEAEGGLTPDADVAELHVRAWCAAVREADAAAGRPHRDPSEVTP